MSYKYEHAKMALVVDGVSINAKMIVAGLAVPYSGGRR